MDQGKIKTIQNQIPKIIEKIYPIEAATLQEIGGYQNRVFEFTYKNNQFILRVTPREHRSCQQIEAELELVNKLKNEGIPVASSVKLPGASAVEEVELEGDTYYLCVFEKAPGKTWIEEPQNEKTFLEAGRVLGKIHTKNEKLPEKLARPCWRENHYLQNACKFIPAEKSWVLEKMENHIGKLDKLPRTKNNFGLVHGDYNFANMLYDDSKVTIIDFDEAEYNWFIYDLAVYLFYYLLGGDPANMELEPNQLVWKKLGEGYSGEKKLDPELVARLPDFLRLREFILYSSLHGSLARGSWGKWQKDFIRTTEDRLKKNQPFVDMDFNRLLGL